MNMINIFNNLNLEKLIYIGLVVLGLVLLVTYQHKRKNRDDDHDRLEYWDED